MKLELLTNAIVVDDAIRFISDKSTKKLSFGNICGDNKESEERDYDMDKDQLEQQKEEKSGEMITKNQVF